jgi:hypothetical protein
LLHLRDGQFPNLGCNSSDVAHAEFISRHRRDWQYTDMQFPESGAHGGLARAPSSSRGHDSSFVVFKNVETGLSMVASNNS